MTVLLLEIEHSTVDEDRKELRMQDLGDLALASTPQLEPRRTEGSSVEAINAGSKVATVYELVQAILSFLPLRDLLLSQRISKTFYHVLKTSMALRRSLHLAPERQTSTGSRLLLILPHGIEFVTSSKAKVVERLGGIAYCNLTISRNLRATGTWRNMFVSQPPLTMFRGTRSKSFGCGEEPGDVCILVPVYNDWKRSPKYGTEGTYLTLGKIHSWAMQAHSLAESPHDLEDDCKVRLVWVWNDAPFEDGFVVGIDSGDSG